MATLSRNFKAVSGASPWAADTAALADGSGYASIETATPGYDLAFSLADLSSLPADMTVDGIAIRIDASKDDANGDGTLTIGCELSWDNGSSHTATATKTVELTSSETIYIVGGPTSLWGRAWTRAELQSGMFKARLQNLGSAIVDTPKWIVDYASLAVYYSSAAALELEFGEHVSIVDTETVSSQSLLWDESLGLSDGGQVPGTEWTEFE